MTLFQLAYKYNTDKAGPQHNYIPFYEANLPANPKKLLEIGIKEGASMRMWREYFPKCELHGMDLFEEFPQPEIEGVTWWKGHQANYYMLEQLLREEFDVIIDDGSHISRHQLMTFFALYTGKHYFIEDLQCCYEDFYQQGLPYKMTANEILRTKFHKGIFSPDQPICLIKQ